MFDQLTGTAETTSRAAHARACATPLILAGRDDLFRAGLHVLLGERGVCSCASDLAGLLAALASSPTALVVVLADQRPGSGLSPAETTELCGRFPQSRLLIVSPLDEIIHAPRFLRAGARGFLMTGRSAEELQAALRAVDQGELYLSPELQRHMNQAAVAERSPEIADLLTSRELEMFLFYGRGYRNAEIARSTRISIKTVDSYRQRIKQKLNLKNASEFTRMAIRYANQT